MRPPPILVLVALGVLVGLAAADAGPLAVAGLAAVAAGVLPAPRGTRRATLRPFALAAFLGAAAGLRARPTAGGDALARRLAPTGSRVGLVGTVLSADPPTPSGTAFVLDAESVASGEGDAPVTARAKVFVASSGERAPPEVLPGDQVHLFGQASVLPPSTNPGAYDAQAAGARSLVFSRVDVPDPRGVEVLSQGGGPLAGLAWLRNAAARGFDAALGPEDGGLVRSLLLGDRGTLAPADRRRFREAGASHILAISGAHVAILVGALLWLLRRVSCPPRPAAGIVLVLVVLFVPFTGSAPPVVRSAAGFVLFLGGRLLGLEPTGGVLLATVAAGYLAIDPAAGGDPGFRMSFAAAAGLILLAGRIHRAIVPERAVLPGIPSRPKAPLRAAVAVGIAAWLGSTPFAVHDLSQMCWVAVPVGVVAVPLSTAVMLAAAVALALAPVPAAGPAAHAAVQGLVAALRWFLDLPKQAGLETFSVVPPGPLWYAGYVAAFVVAARGGRRAAAAGGVSLALLLAGLSAPLAREPPPWPRLTLLDVGHGQAALLEAPDGQTALLDSGSRDRPEPAARIVLPALRALRVTALTLASASHADADHAGALPAVLDEVPAGLVAVPPRFPPALLSEIVRGGATPLTVADGDVLLAGPWGRLAVIGPSRRLPPRTSTNDGCLVLLLDTPNGRVLLPGDRETPGIDALLAAHPGLRAEVLVLPHHGHLSAGRDRLVRESRAGVLLSSAPESAAAVQPAGTRVTGVEGALAVELRPGGPVVVHLSPRGDGASRGYDPARGAPPPTMADSPTLLAAALALVGIGLLAARLRWLTPAGAALAACLGYAAVLAFSWPGLLALLAPFLVATLLGRLPPGPGGGGDEGPRTARQVAANGLPAVLGIVIALARPTLGATAFLGALSALGADTVATEVGTRFGGVPRHVVTWRPMRRGESGGVTWAGLLASAVGASLAPAAFLLSSPLAPSGPRGFYLFSMLLVAGVDAGLIDSVLGATLQRKGECPSCEALVETRTHCGVPIPVRGARLSFLDNDAVNLANGLAGTLLGAWLASLALR